LNFSCGPPGCGDWLWIFGGAAAQAIVAQFVDTLAAEPTYDDFIAVDGKANY
jgi:hypothetical protein